MTSWMGMGGIASINSYGAVAYYRTGTGSGGIPTINFQGQFFDVPQSGNQFRAPFQQANLWVECFDLQMFLQNQEPD